MADQAVSSLGNFVALAWAGTQLGARDFGAVGTAFALYSLALVIGRAAVGEVALIELGHGKDRVKRSHALGASAAIGLVAGLALSLSAALFALAGSAALSTALVLLGAALPPLLVQDSLRYLAIGTGRAQLALANDCIWLIGLVAAITVVRADTSLSIVMISWGASGTMACIMTLGVWRIVPALGSTRSWLKNTRHLWPTMLGDSVVAQGARHLSVITLTAAIGLAASGQIRLTQVAFGPLTVIVLSIPLIALQPLAHLATNSAERAHSRVAQLAAGAFAVCLLWTVALLVVPSDTASRAFGGGWQEARGFILPMGVYTAAAAASASFQAGARALLRPRTAFRVRLITGPILVAAPACVGLAAGARSAAWTLAAIELVTVALLSVSLRSGAR